MMFTHVIMLHDNQRVKASNEQQNVFQNLLSHLCNGDSTEDDWRLLLTQRPLPANKLDEFKTATRLFYSNEDVAAYNY